MDFMSDDFAAFPSGVAPDLYSSNVMDLSTKASPSPSGGDVSSEAGDGAGHHHKNNSYVSTLRSRSKRATGATTPLNGRDGSPDDGSSGPFSLKETFHLLDAVNKHLSELTNPKLKKYRIWVRIAEDVNKSCDAKFNGGQCSSRFRNLKCRFGKLQAHFKSTGELKTWPFYNRMLGMFPDEASFNWLNSVVPNDAKQDGEDGDEAGGDEVDGADQEVDDEEGDDTASVGESPPGHPATRARGGHTSGFTTNSAGELVPCFTLRESMTLLDVVRKHIGELKDPRTCKGKIWAKVAADVNRRCGCGHTGAQCSARYRNLKCRFLKRKQKGTDTTWTFGAKLASVLDAENEVKVEMAAAATTSTDNNNTNTNNGSVNGSLTNSSMSGSERHQQLSSLLSSKNEPLSLKSGLHQQATGFVPTITAAHLRSRSSAASAHQHQALDLHNSSNSRHNSNSNNYSQLQLHQQQQRRRRSRISTGPRARLPIANSKELLASGTVNLVSNNSISGTSPVAVESSVSGTPGSDCFTASETVTLLDLVAKYLKDLNSPAESGVRRHDIWTRIAAELNDAYGTHYTSTQCSARFRNLKCRFIKTQEYNRVTGADKKVAFNDNIARLFAAESAMSGDAAVNLIDGNSNSGEQPSPLPPPVKLSIKSSPAYVSPPPTPSSHLVNGGSNNNNNYNYTSVSSSSPPGAHGSNAFQNNQRPSMTTPNPRLAAPSPSIASSNGSRSMVVNVKNNNNNGAVPLVLTSNSRSNSLQQNNAPIRLTNKVDPLTPSPHLNNGSAKQQNYYGADQIQTAHSRSPSSASFALPQPVHRPPSHQSSPRASRNQLTASPISSGYSRQVYGVDLSAGQPSHQIHHHQHQQQQHHQQSHQHQAMNLGSARMSSSPAVVAPPPPRLGREVVIEQLRIMHEDWVRVTERRHNEVMTVLRQLASHMAAAGMSTPVIDGAVVMCQPEDGLVEEEEEEEEDDPSGLVSSMMEPEDNGDELTAEVDLMDTSVAGVEEQDGDNVIVKEECNGELEVDEADEVDEEDLASSISSSAVELAE